MNYKSGGSVPKANKKVQTLTMCGLFTALVAIGAFIQITIPVQPLPIVGWLTERFHPRHIFSYLAVSMAGFAVMYLSGNLYYYVVSNYVLDTPVPWSVVIFNCFILTASGDFLLCVLASLTARRLIPIISRVLS